MSGRRWTQHDDPGRARLGVAPPQDGTAELGLDGQTLVLVEQRPGADRAVAAAQVEAEFPLPDDFFFCGSFT
jgi:hypothetical protein